MKKTASFYIHLLLVQGGGAFSSAGEEIELDFSGMKTRSKSERFIEVGTSYFCRG